MSAWHDGSGGAAHPKTGADVSNCKRGAIPVSERVDAAAVPRHMEVVCLSVEDAANSTSIESCAVGDVW